MRTCIACRTVRAKRELVRLVCAGEAVEIDTGGKKPGRGVYLCPASHCWETSLKHGRLEHALRTTIPGPKREELVKYGQSLDRNKGIIELGRERSE